MTRIKSITLKNIKFFGESQTLSLDGKHCLIYGENGSGKSSVYWTLYRLLASANKLEEAEISKYFVPNGEFSWLNVYEVANGNHESEISLLLDDDSLLKLTDNDYSINKNQVAKESNMASEFLSYKFLYKLLDFTVSEDIDLFTVFHQQLLPYIRFQPVTYWRKNQTTGIIEDYKATNALQIFNFVKKGPQDNFPNQKRELKFPPKNTQQYLDYKKIVDGFEASMQNVMNQVNAVGNPILKQDLDHTITFDVRFIIEKPFALSLNNFEPPKYKIELNITDYEGLGPVVKKPHAFLNEAKLTAVGLAIRLAVLRQRLQTAKLKILVVDDLLISLDMSNREKVLKLIFSKYLTNYQVFILTHDRVLFEFVRMFIDQKSNRDQWAIYEMYEGESDDKKIKFPVIIDSKANYFEKADSYFKVKDYTACSFYLRKELEKLVKERLTDEQTRTFDEGQKFHALKYLWDKMVERYAFLNSPVSEDLKEKFESSKIMVLNAQAHDNLSFPVYKLEIEKAIELIKEISLLKIPNKIILLQKGMLMQFKHPTEDYSLDFELLQDFYIDNLDATREVHFPNCRILTWQYKGNEFWDFRHNVISIPQKLREEKINKILLNITRIPVLAINESIVLENTKLLGGIWTLKDIIDKSGITLNLNPQNP
jgi:ABC-type lipoprotein export system ATPase subunit